MEGRKTAHQKRKRVPKEGLFPEAIQAKRVLLTGATGFVGRAMLQELLAQHFQVVALARKHPTQEARPGLIRVAADVASQGWERWVEGCEAAIHLVGIIRENPKENVSFHRVHVEGTARVLEVCQKLNIKRYLHMSAVGANPRGITPYYRSKGQAEELVKASGLSWTIFRPSVVFGPGDGFTTALAKAMSKFLVVPVFGNGLYPIQPIAVEEVVQAFVASLGKPETVGQVIELGGPEVLTYLEVLRRTARSLKKRRFFVKVPLPWARLGVRVMAKLLANPPVTPDELSMLLAGVTPNTSLARELLPLPQKAFRGIEASNQP